LSLQLEGKKLNSKQKIYEYELAMNSLGIYRGILKDSVIKSLYSLITNLRRNENDVNEIISEYNIFYFELMEKSEGKSLKNYIAERIIYSDNAFAKVCQSSEFEQLPEEIKSAASNDMKNLQFLSIFSRESVIDYFGGVSGGEKLNKLPFWQTESSSEDVGVNILLSSTQWENSIHDLWSFHYRMGTGLFSRFKGFIWEGDALHGVVSLDPVSLDQLVNYERQKAIVVNNTRAFLKGKKANNILLYGSRGTGKSSTVKALLNEFHADGLRVIEIPKQHLITFPRLIRILKNSPLKFILFIDDLAFEDSEETYTALKAILEGGLESKPDNVIIYATSNRRHIVKENSVTEKILEADIRMMTSMRQTALKKSFHLQTDSE
jgi:Predicted ATPase (AAA+ superfamily)